MTQRYIVTLIILFSTMSCIEEYRPLLETKDIGNYVVYGTLTDQEGYQIIYISRSSDTQYPEYKPADDCDVVIIDEFGNRFQLEESYSGEYKGWIDQEYLNIGTSYKVNIHTPTGEEISSDFEIMPECAEIDSVYYIIEDKPTTNPEEPIKGIQFYLDFIGNENHSRFYRYTIEETWEYHAKYPNQGFYNGTLTRIDPPDYSKLTCWKTQMVPEIFVLSTNNLSENSYFEFPLHYIENTTEKLAYGYSFLIKQNAISQTAYLYWTKIRNNTINDGGLYEKQPELIQGNVYNLTNSDKKVLGYFNTSSVKTKRIFIKTVKELILDYPCHCVEHVLKSTAYGIYYPFKELPVYLYFINNYPVYWLNDNCVDCTGRGGTNIKPDFWPY